MRLILDADVRPGTVERLRALSPDLEVVDRTGDPTFDVATLADPDVEVLIGGRAPDDLGRRARRCAGSRSARPAWTT